MTDREGLPRCGQYLRYPFMRIAKAFDLPVSVIYAVAQFQESGSLTPYEKARFEFFEYLHRYHPQTGSMLYAYIDVARTHFREQQMGLRDMDGVYVGDNAI